MSILREVCHCGHDKDTHFERKHACLGSRCDCEIYRDEQEPDTNKAPPRNPNHAQKYRGGKYEECACFDCRRFREWKEARNKW